MFVMIIEIDAGALTLAVPARDAPIADRSFDLFRLAVRYRLRDAALIPPRDRARSEDRENTDRDEGILLQPDFPKRHFITAPARINPRPIRGNHQPMRSFAMRSAERRVGKACVSTCSSRWSPHP